MRKLSIYELNRISVDEFRESDKLPLIVILDDVRSMYNVGSIFRTSDAFRVECIYLCGITPRPPHQEIHKTALGAEESVKWQYAADCTDVIDRLKSEGYYIYGVEQVEDSVMLNDLDIPSGSKVAVILGNEVKGVQQHLIDKCDGCIEIPQFGTKHSLNVSTAGGIVIWEIWKKIRR